MMPMPMQIQAALDSAEPFPFRRAGKTFRAIMQSLQAASAGNRIVFMCADSQRLIWAMQKAFEIIKTYGLDDAVRVNQSSRSIYIGEKGIVSFVSATDIQPERFHGIEGELVADL